MTIYGNDGKTTYTDGDFLSGDLREKVRSGDKDALQKLKDFAATRDPDSRTRKPAPCTNWQRFISTNFVKLNARPKKH